MTGGSTIAGRIREEFSAALKEYAAFGRTLDAVAALSYVLSEVTEVAHETELADFRPKIEPAVVDGDPYTPDGHIVARPCDFLLELKTSWNEKDIAQVVKYGKSAAYFLPDGSRQSFKSSRCMLLGYQNPPGELNLDALFDSWESNGTYVPLVVLRYSLEQGAEGDRMYFVRVPYGRNGLCPASSLGKALNSPRGFPVSTEAYRLHRARFHKTNDQAIASYAAIVWWTKYVRHYLSEEQRGEMADRGRLSSPLIIGADQISTVPPLAGVEVPLGPRDIHHALEFLAQARLVSFKRRKGTFEVELREDRYIRVPADGPVLRSNAPDISTKILARWARHKVKSPVNLSPTKRGKGGARRRGAVVDPRQGKLF
jgi:hypothetical protein